MDSSHHPPRRRPVAPAKSPPTPPSTLADPPRLLIKVQNCYPLSPRNTLVYVCKKYSFPRLHSLLLIAKLRSSIIVVRLRMLDMPHGSLKLPQGQHIFCEFRTLHIPGIELNPPALEALKRMHMLAADPGIRYYFGHFVKMAQAIWAPSDLLLTSHFGTDSAISQLLSSLPVTLLTVLNRQFGWQWHHHSSRSIIPNATSKLKGY
ncbi:hypothetical protein RHMOL_Rhmol10G0135300 [Rhododendron molle]|uniref:Uncharacterized protein n=1 Tax=Rhododendron molle TaxID=49168 RepID=A0ACC0M1Y3_RHOML|nr:hypothetical protein RHMOL_Rhmol10G0135300 [Rhododendron molle]